MAGEVVGDEWIAMIRSLGRGAGFRGLINYAFHNVECIPDGQSSAN